MSPIMKKFTKNYNMNYKQERYKYISHAKRVHKLPDEEIGKYLGITKQRVGQIYKGESSGKTCKICRGWLEDLRD